MRRTVTNRVSVTARTVAVRGEWFSSAISPNDDPGPSRRTSVAVAGDDDLTVEQDVEQVARFALGDDRGAGRHGELGRVAAEALELGERGEPQGRCGRVAPRGGAPAGRTSRPADAASATRGRRSRATGRRSLPPLRRHPRGPPPREPAPSRARSRPTSATPGRRTPGPAPGPARCAASGCEPPRRRSSCPAPQTARSTATPSVVAPSGTRASGTPVATIPAARAGLSRRRPTSATVRMPPSTLPMPSALPSRPGPELLVPSSSSAKTISRMSSAPTTTYWLATMPTRTAAGGSWRSSRRPSRAALTSRSPWAGSPASGVQAGDRPGDQEHEHPEQREHRLGAAGDHEQPAGQRTEEGAESLGRRRGGVSGEELLGRARQCRERGVVHRPGDRDGAGREGRAGRDGGEGQVGPDRCGGREHRGALGGVPEGQRLPATEPVAQGRAERGDEGGGDELDHRQHGRGVDTGALVAPDQHGDPGGPLGDREDGERKQRAAQRGAAEGRPGHQHGLVHVPSLSWPRFVPARDRVSGLSAVMPTTGETPGGRRVSALVTAVPWTVCRRESRCDET